MTIDKLAACRTASNGGSVGSASAAYRITGERGETGLAFYSHRWHKRDMLSEQLFAEPAVLELLRNFIPEEGPQVLDVFTIRESHGDAAILQEASEKATETIWNTND